VICITVAVFSPQNEFVHHRAAGDVARRPDATQDIVLELPYRRGCLPDMTGFGLPSTSMPIALPAIPGSLSLILADHLPWNMVFIITNRIFLLSGHGDDACW